MTLVPPAPRTRITIEGYLGSWGLSLELLEHDEAGNSCGPGRVVGVTAVALWVAWAEAHDAEHGWEPTERAAASLHTAVLGLVSARERAGGDLMALPQARSQQSNVTDLSRYRSRRRA